MSERHFMENANGLERQQRLKAIGVERLTLLEMQATAVSFGKHLRAGIEKRPSSLATIPTLLSPIDLEAIPKDKQALVVEIGGTNIYGGLINMEGEKPRLVQHVEHP